MPKGKIEIRQEDCRKTRSKKGFDLVIADPPFNVGQKYNGHDDSMKDIEYREFTLQWIQNCMDLLSPNGVMALHGPDSLVEQYLLVPRLAGMDRIGWVNWHYRFGMCGRSNWIDSRCHCIFFAKSKDYIWNPESVLVESDRVGYGDKRIGETERGGKRVPLTVWGIPSDGKFWGRVQGGNAERWSKKQGAPIDHPNQLPIVYISRIIKAYTNPGSSVFDAFCGSGTVPLVCGALERSCLSVDIDKATVDSAILRQKAHEKVAKERA